MGDEKHDEGDWELPLRKPFDVSSQPASCHAETQDDARQEHSLKHSRATRHLDVATRPGATTFPNPGIQPPGIFVDYYIPGFSRVPEIRGTPISNETYIEEFHDSESEDIYDLYNACNGTVRAGLLDIRKLDELSKEELEALNVNRLREIWLHTRSGCATCAGIVRTLNSVRGMLCDEEFEGTTDRARPVNGKPH